MTTNKFVAAEISAPIAKRLLERLASSLSNSALRERRAATSKQKPALGEFEHRVMVAVLDGGDEAYGLKIAERMLEEDSGLAIAQVYVTLSRLQQKGFLSSQLDAPRPTKGGRARRVFAVTNKGMSALEQSTAFRKALVTSSIRQEGTRHGTKEEADDEFEELVASTA